MALPVSTAWRSNARVPGRASPELAQQVAMRIEEDIVGSGWQVGARIGSEAELCEAYDQPKRKARRRIAA